MEDVLAAITAIGYSGWVIVEQDIFPDPAEPADRPAADQAANREWLRERGI
jgi:inosose dehydratase